MQHILLCVLLFAVCLNATSSCEVCDEHGTCTINPECRSDTITTTTITSSSLRVAIVGGGIAGSSTAYYISQLLPSVDITVYEKEPEVCGRVQDTIINGRQVEVGGSIYHESNTNVDGFVHQFNLTRLSPLGGSTVGIWNGKEFVFRGSDIPVIGEIVNIVKMFYRYGWAPYNLKGYLDSLMSNWTQLYNMTEPFDTVDEFFARLGLQDDATSLAPKHLEQYGISRQFTEELLGSMTRVNYNTDVNIMNAFGVAVSAIGSGDDIYSVQEGNKLICTNLVTSAKAESKYGSTVTVIRKHEENKYEVETEAGEKLVYDIVVIAAPLELSKIKLENMDIDDYVFHARDFQEVHVTFVAGALNPSYFNLASGKAPSFVLTVEDPSIPFSSIGRSKNITDEAGRPVSKVFSRTSLTQETLSKVFVNGTVVYKKAIHAYPILRPPTKFVPIQLAHNLYYVNSMESVISTIETETISAKNIARLIAKSLGLEYSKKL